MSEHSTTSDIVCDQIVQTATEANLNSRLFVGDQCISYILSRRVKVIVKTIQNLGVAFRSACDSLRLAAYLYQIYGC